MAVRSRVLLSARDIQANGAGITYTVPAGRTAIVREIFVYNSSGGAQGVGVLVRRGPNNHAYLASQQVAAGAVFRMTGYFPLDPGDGLTLTCDGPAGTFRVYAGGVLLEGAPA